MSDYSRGDNVGTAERLFDAAWRNPEGLLLLAAGAALLMRRGVASSAPAPTDCVQVRGTATLIAIDQLCMTSATGWQRRLNPLATMRQTWPRR